MRQRSVKEGGSGYGIRGPLVERCGRSVRKHGGGIPQPIKVGKRGIRGGGPATRPWAGTATQGHRCTSLRRPQAAQVEEPKRATGGETDEPGLPSRAVDQALLLEDLGDAGRSFRGRVEHPELLKVWWRLVMIETGGGDRTKKAKSVPGRRMVAALKVKAPQFATRRENHEIGRYAAKLRNGRRLGELGHAIEQWRGARQHPDRYRGATNPAG